MKATIQLDIVSLEAKIFSGLVEMVIVPGIMGELGILPGHTPLLTAIHPGQIRITLYGGTRDTYYTSGGILEIQPTAVTILADTVIHSASLTEAAATSKKAEALRILANKKSNIDFTDALVHISQATAKLRNLNLPYKQK